MSNHITFECPCIKHSQNLVREEKPAWLKSNLMGGSGKSKCVQGFPNSHSAPWVREAGPAPRDPIITAPTPTPPAGPQPPTASSLVQMGPLLNHSVPSISHQDPLTLYLIFSRTTFSRCLSYLERLMCFSVFVRIATPCWCPSVAQHQARHPEYLSAQQRLAR